MGLRNLESEVGVITWFLKRLKRSQGCDECPQMRRHNDATMLV